MDSHKKDIGLILAIIFASAAISGSMVFFGIQASGKANCDVLSTDKIKEAFKSFVDEQQTQQVAQQQQAQDQQDKNSEDLAKQNLKPVSKTDDHIRGNKDAKISLVQYSDFECPYCKKFYPIGLQLLAAYGDKINWVYRQYPLSFHDPMATKEAEASECIAELGGNDAFWKFVDLAYTKTQSGGNGLSENDLVDFAGQIGVDKAAFQSCLSSGKYDAKVKQDIAEADKAGISGTPGNVFVNHTTGEIKVLNGAQPLVKFKALVDAMLAK
jgi:protein-disulfide isomerase